MTLPLYHVVVPRNYRKSTLMTISKELREEKVKDEVKYTIHTVSSEFPVVMSVKREGDDAQNADKSRYRAVYLNLPQELIYKLKKHHFFNCVFYVGSHEDTETKILEDEPTDDMIAKQDRQGNDAPYWMQVDISEARDNAKWEDVRFDYG